MAEERKLKTESGTVSIGGNQSFVNTPDEIPRFYSNNVEITFSTWDMHLTFSEVIAAHQEKGQLLQRVARVTMSLEHTKIFIELLARSLLQFERAVGRPIELYEIDASKLVEKAPAENIDRERQVPIDAEPNPAQKRADEPR
jgi:hypothetical protein